MNKINKLNLSEIKYTPLDKDMPLNDIPISMFNQYSFEDIDFTPSLNNVNNNNFNSNNVKEVKKDEIPDSVFYFSNANKNNDVSIDMNYPTNTFNHVLKDGVNVDRLDGGLKNILSEYSKRGVNFRITEGFATKGHTEGSWHYKGMGLDITPLDKKDYKGLLNKMRQHPDLIEKFKQQGYRLHDERTRGGKEWSGAHLHIGKDSKVDINNWTNLLQQGGRIPLRNDYSRPRNVQEDKSYTYDNLFKFKPKFNYVEKPIEIKATTGNVVEDKALDDSYNKVDAIRNRLMQENYNENQIYGILGSLYQESGLKEDSQNSSSKAIGIAQWLGPRKTELENYAKSTNRNHLDFDTQLDFLVKELNSNSAWLGKSRRDKFMNAKTMGEASDLFTKLFERPHRNEAMMNKRRMYGDYIYKKLYE